MTPALHPYRVHCAGLQYITLARSACEAMISAIDLPSAPRQNVGRMPPGDRWRSEMRADAPGATPGPSH